MTICGWEMHLSLPSFNSHSSASWVQSGLGNILCGSHTVSFHPEHIIASMPIIVQLLNIYPVDQYGDRLMDNVPLCKAEAWSGNDKPEQRRTPQVI